MHSSSKDFENSSLKWGGKQFRDYFYLGHCISCSAVCRNKKTWTPPQIWTIDSLLFFVCSESLPRQTYWYVSLLTQLMRIHLRHINVIIRILMDMVVVELWKYNPTADRSPFEQHSPDEIPPLSTFLPVEIIVHMPLDGRLCIHWTGVHVGLRRQVLVWLAETQWFKVW